MEKKNLNTITYLVVLAGLLIFVASKSTLPQSSNSIDSTATWDISEEVKENNLEQYLVETPDFDFSNEEVYKLAQQIKSSTATPYDAIKKTAKYVVTNVQYNSKISVSYCYEETASKVLSTGKGDCVSMSRLVTALLRAQGIPARTVGGCLTSERSCLPMFAAIPSFEARVTPMEQGDNKKRGFLHEWVEVFSSAGSEMSGSPGKWLVIEATSGQVFKINCDSYLQYSYDTNKYERCVIDSSAFWNSCSVA